MKILMSILLLILGAYGVLTAALYFGQRSLMYRPPETIARTPASAGFPAASNIRIKTADGEQLVAWFAPPKEGKPIVIFFHGNAEVISWRAKRFQKLTGTGLLGSLSEHANASQTLDELARNVAMALADGSKAELALDLLALDEADEFNVPSYIHRGLLWLAEQLRRKQAEVVLPGVAQ